MKFNSLARVIFDLIMLVFLAAVYCAQPTGIPAHEYIGLGIYLLFIIHLAYNYKWILNVCRTFFDKTAGIRIKFAYAIDVLLLIAFILIGLSGVMISHVIFKFGVMPVWRPLHTIASAVSVVLLSVHIGLHGTMIINAVKTKIKLPFTVIKIATCVIFAVILGAGIYGDVISKVKPENNQVTGRPRFETVLALFDRSVKLLSGPPEYVRNRAAAGSSGSGENSSAEVRGGGGGNRNAQAGGGSARQAPPQRKFDINTLLVSVSNYAAFILLCSILVFLIDKRITKNEE